MLKWLAVHIGHTGMWPDVNIHKPRTNASQCNHSPHMSTRSSYSYSYNHTLCTLDLHTSPFAVQHHTVGMLSDNN